MMVVSCGSERIENGMKKLINRPEHVIEEMMEGLLVLYPGLSRLSNHSVLVRSDAEDVRERQIALISGGGSGHEPAHAGYVGAGMLSAAVAGEVFTSPSAESVLAAIRAVTGRPGALLIVKNYTGDRLNFGLAAEMARAEGYLVEMVVVADDVALAGSEEHAGRRGIAGTVLVHKIAGAAAMEGKDLPQVASLAQAAADSVGTMGVSLSAGTSPASGKPSFTLLDHEVEIGLGIHGEPGVRRTAMMRADDLTDQLLHGILSTLRLRSDERIAVLINNLGSTTGMELAIVARRTLRVLESRGLAVERLYSGTFVSSLDMAGVSISVLRVDDERLRWLDAGTDAPAWPNALRKAPGSLGERTTEEEGASMFEALQSAKPAVSALESPGQTRTGAKTEKAIRAACAALLAAESRLTEMDQLVGDGDLGLNLARGMRAIEEKLPTYPLNNTAETLKALGLTLQAVLGGSSGPLYGVLLLRIGSSLENGAIDDARMWAAALMEGCEALSELGGARVGDRTMLDALIPFARSFQDEVGAGRSTGSSLLAAAAAAERSAEGTAQMVARRGRSSYLGNRTIGCADPGAIAVAIWLRAVSSALAER
jgi:triose/dihydroxyacetone kinase / FAD-AMP lyase (cyclizing)